MDERIILAHATLAVLEDRIHELWTRRQWYRDHLGWIPENQTEDRAELRLLVGLARKARALAVPAIERVDAVTSAKALRFDDEGTLLPGQYPDPAVIPYHDWQTAS